MKKILVAALLCIPVLAWAYPPSDKPEDPTHSPAKVPVSSAPFTRTLRSVTPADIARLHLNTGTYSGSPAVKAKQKWYEDHFYDTLAARKVWHSGTSPETHERGGPVTWDIAPIPQYTPPPCNQPQPTGYDAEGCRIANALYKDIEKTDPKLVADLREKVRRGRDVWHKGSFGNQDENLIHLARTVGKENMWYPWLDTRTRPYRFTKWGLINDPDCVQGSEKSFWMDVCQDAHSPGVLGYRKYYADPTKDASGKVVFDPKSSPYDPNEMKQNKRFVIGHACTQCHVGFDPTDPPVNPNEPKWENLMELIGNQHTRQPMAFLLGTPENSPARQVIMGGRPGTIDTSLAPNDFMHNPGTQNNITDFMNRRVFTEHMKDPITGEIKTGYTQHILKGGEDTVGDRLALLRVYINIGMCTEECWVPNFPVPGSFFGEGSHQRPMHIKQCSKDCDAWNYADAKMGDLVFFLLTGGPTYLMKAKDLDGSAGPKYVDMTKVPQGRQVFAKNCAGCHSSVVPPENIRSDKEALSAFFEGHVFGNEEYWQKEFTPEQLASTEFQKKYLTKDLKTGKLVPKQFAENGAQFGQDWLGNDELTAFNVVGTNSCRARHDNHSTGHIWEEFASEEYRQRPSPGSVPDVINRMFPLVGGTELGRKTIGGDGSGYYRNISLLSLWAIAPFLHNNAIGEMTYLPDGSPDYTVAGRIKQFELAVNELLTSDNPAVTPHRPQKTTVIDRDIKIAPREDMQGPIKLTVPKGTPVAYFASSDPHNPLFMKCDDLVENKGHQFGVDLPAADKAALIEFLKLM